MVKELIHDPLFLARKSAPATKEDLPIAEANGVLIENLHISDSLMTLSYRLTEFENKLYAVLYPYDPEKQEVIDDKVFFVLDDDDTMTAINTDDILAQLDQLYEELENAE